MRRRQHINWTQIWSIDLKDICASDRKHITCLFYTRQLTIKLCDIRTYQQRFTRSFKVILVSVWKLSTFSQKTRRLCLVAIWEGLEPGAQECSSSTNIRLSVFLLRKHPADITQHYVLRLWWNLLTISFSEWNMPHYVQKRVIVFAKGRAPVAGKVRFWFLCFILIINAQLAAKESSIAHWNRGPRHEGLKLESDELRLKNKLSRTTKQSIPKTRKWSVTFEFWGFLCFNTVEQFLSFSLLIFSLICIIFNLHVSHPRSIWRNKNQLLLVECYRSSFPMHSL